MEERIGWLDWLGLIVGGLQTLAGVALIAGAAGGMVGLLDLPALPTWVVWVGVGCAIKLDARALLDSLPSVRR